jgi:predicted TIM-barrel fold metal-dependent hydrolase
MPSRPPRSAASALARVAASLALCAGSHPGYVEAPAVRAAVPFADVHTHPESRGPAEAVESALRAMPAENAVLVVFLPPPFTASDADRFDAELLLPLVKGHTPRLAVLGGGGTLNPMIHNAVRSRDAGPEVQRRFRERAEALLRAGVVGFGEMAAEHFPGATPYESAPPDHPLFLLLADVAAEHAVPIVLHMEAVAEPIPPPAGLESPPLPPRLLPNIDALERLLSHDDRARIIWAHAGSDPTGHRTPALCRRLLAAHANLYMEVKVDPAKPGKNSPLPNGLRSPIDPQWLKLFQDFPDRFVIGTDQHYPQPAVGPQRWEAAALLLNQLPPDLQRRIGSENAARLYSPSRALTPSARP